MTKHDKNPAHRPPVGGYGTKSKKYEIRLPEYLYNWLMRIGPEGVRSILKRAYGRDKGKKA